jgi:hypothetical protein
MEDTKKLAQQLMNDAEKLPPMTEDERNAQRLDFAYGNLACSANHKPVRALTGRQGGRRETNYPR